MILFLGIINYTKSTAGSKLLRQWFLHPLTNIDEIKERQLAIASFLSNRNLEAVMAFQDSMKHMKNISVSCPVFKVYFRS